MIEFKKVYSDELLRLALILSLLKSDPQVHVEEQRIAAGLNTANGSDWSLEEEARFMLRPQHIHPKSLDNILLDYERQVFEELNSLGRYYDVYTNYIENNRRISHNNESPIFNTYVVNNVTTDTVSPTPLAEYFENNTEFDAVADDSNVAHEEELVSSDCEEEKEDIVLVDSVTTSESYLHNRTEEFEELNQRSFDISEFFISPPAMQIKTEQPDINIKKESFDDQVDLEYLYDESESYDLFAEVDKVAQSGGMDETLETLRDFRMSMEYLDVKQEIDLEKFLLENTPLDHEEPVTSFKRERVGTSFTSVASSSGVSEIDSDDESAARISVKTERNDGEDLSQEDVDLIEILWKQDVDMGFSREDPFRMLSDDLAKVTVETAFDPPTKKSQIELEPKKKDHEEKKEEDVDPWAGLSYVVDTETGEYLLQGELPPALVAEEGAEDKFDYLEEALKLVELDDQIKNPPPATAASAKVEEDSDEAVSVSEDTMLHPAAPRPHPHHHGHPHHAFYHPAVSDESVLHPAAQRPHHHLYHQSLMRQMSAEQRWQDVVSLLSGPPPPHPHHGATGGPSDNPYHQGQHYNIGAPHHPSAASYNYPPAPHHHPHMPPPPPLEKHHNSSYCGPIESEYKMEGSAAHHSQHEPLYYQQPDINGTSDGFLSSILNDDELMDMAVNEGMYTMRMLDGTPVPQHPSVPTATAIQHSPYTTTTLPGSNGIERADSGSDSAVSSMGSERVASLSDGEWCDDNAAPDFSGSKFRPYETSSSHFGRSVTDRTSAAAGPSAPQKKHHMFGKRCFQESLPSSSDGGMHLERSLRPPVKYEYTEMTNAYEHQLQSQAASEYASRVAHSNAVMASGTPLQTDVVTPLHPAMLQHAQMAAVPGSDRIRHNHTYSVPPNPHSQLRPYSRDKKLRRMTETGSTGGGSESGHTSRDEKRAKALGIPIDVSEIINLPMDEFNERLSKHDLSEPQLSLIRDIRRRGKNKVAAQNCRKRKLDQITCLADEVRTVRERKARLNRERHAALVDRQRIKDRFAALYRHVFQHLRDAEGRPVSSTQYSLQQAADGAVVLVPKMHSDQSQMRPTDEDLDRKQGKGYDQ